MNFCKVCENKLYPMEENGTLVNKCINCGFSEEFNGTIIEKKNYKTSETLASATNKHIIFDPTLPRTTQSICPNNLCISNEKPELRDAVLVQDAITIKLIHICVNCGTEWQY